MTIEQIQNWCKTNGAAMRGILRGADFMIQKDGAVTPAGSPVGNVFHWELHLNDKKYPVSTSDMERLVTGKMDVMGFLGTRSRE